MDKKAYCGLLMVPTLNFSYVKIEKQRGLELGRSCANLVHAVERKCRAV